MLTHSIARCVFFLFHLTASRHKCAQVKVQSMDSKVFEIPAKVAKMSVTLKNLIEGTLPTPPTPTRFR